MLLIFHTNDKLREKKWHCYRKVTIKNVILKI